MSESPFVRRLKDRASRAAQGLLDNEAAGEAMAVALKRLQSGRRSLDDLAQRLVGVLGLATTEDLVRVQRRIGHLRKRLRRLVDQHSQ